MLEAINRIRLAAWRSPSGRSMALRPRFTAGLPLFSYPEVIGPDHKRAEPIGRNERGTNGGRNQYQCRWGVMFLISLSNFRPSIVWVDAKSPVTRGYRP